MATFRLLNTQHYQSFYVGFALVLERAYLLSRAQVCVDIGIGRSDDGLTSS